MGGAQSVVVTILGRVIRNEAFHLSQSVYLCQEKRGEDNFQDKEPINSLLC